MESSNWLPEVVPFVVLFLYLAPLIWVLSSSRSRGGAKLGWFIVVLVFSWLGFAAFLIVTQPPKPGGTSSGGGEVAPTIGGSER
jgi:hypothetical protein